MPPVLDRLVAYFSNGYANTPSAHRTFREVLTDIRDGTYRHSVGGVREALRDRGRDAYDQAKKKLPAVAMSCDCATRAKEVAIPERGIVHTGVLQIDLDRKDNPELDLAQTRAALEAHPSIAFVFGTPSGEGLKAGLVIDCAGDADDLRHAALFPQVEAYFQVTYALKIDRSVKDVVRLAFVSYDPELSMREDAVPWIPEAVRQPSQSAPIVSSRNSRLPLPPPTADEVRKMLSCIPPRPEYSEWLRIASSVWSVLTMEDGCRLLAEWSPEEKAGEYAAKHRHKLDQIGIGTLIKIAQDHGYRSSNQLPRTHAAQASKEIDASAFPGPRFPAIETEPAEESILPDSAPIVADLVEPGDKVIIASGSKSYKTWLLIQLALCISMGLHWLGFRTIRTRVLFLNFEIKPRNFWRRVYRIRAALNLQKSDDFQVWNLRGKGFNMDDHRGELIERAKQCGAGVIILDPIYKLFGDRNESSAGDMATLMTLFDRVATETGAAIVFSHHFAKGTAASKDAVDRASGSGVFARDPDCILTLTRLDEAEGKNTFAASVTLRDFPAVDDFAVRRDHPIMVRVDDVNVRNLHEPAKRLSKYTPEQVVGVLPAAGASIAEWQRLTKDQLGMSRSTFYDTYATPAKKLARFTSGLWHKSG